MLAFRSFFQRILPLWQRYPIELCFALITACLAAHFDWYREVKHNAFMLHAIVLSPFYFAAIYLSNLHRIAYRLSWLYPLLGTLCFGYLEAIENFPLELAGFALLHALLFFTKGFERDNRKFTHLTLVTLINTTFAGILSGIVYLIICGILSGVAFLFAFDIPFELYEKVSFFVMIFGTAFFFLMLESRTAEYHPHQDGLLYAGEILINWIFSPAVMIYTAIVYVYLAMILLQFELPVGRVSTVILPYLGLGLVCIALRQFSARPKWQWFYCYFAHLSLIPLGLLWLGIYERVSEYGLTEPRIFLIAISALVTLFILCSLRPAWLQYRMFSAFTMAMIACVLIIFSPTKLSEQSQHRQFVKVMSKYDLLDEQGKIRLDANAALSKISKQDRSRLDNIIYHLGDSEKAFYGKETLSKLDEMIWELDNLAETVEKNEQVVSYGRYDYLESEKSIELTPFKRFTVQDLYASQEENRVVSFSTYDEQKRFTLNHQQISTVLERHGIEKGKRYKSSELQEAMKALQLLPTEQGATLLLSNLNLRYSEEHQHYVVEYARAIGYLEP